ncbi:MAG: hypothetical protein ACWGOX_07620, partial [Desulforhopalus sp.]
SYLKGPMSKNDIKRLAPGKIQEAKPVDNEVSLPLSAPQTLQDGTSLPPLVPRDMEQRYYLQNLPIDVPLLMPELAATASVRFFNSKRNIDIVEEVDLRLSLDESFVEPDWERACKPAYTLDDCSRHPPSTCTYSPLPSGFVRHRDLRALTRDYSDYLYRHTSLELFRVKGEIFESEPYETLADFRVRFNDHLRERKEEAIDKLRATLQTRQDRLDEKLTRALDKLEKEKIDVRTRTTDSLISFGAAVAGALFGRKTLSAANIGKAATGIRSAGRLAKEKSDVQRAERDVLEVQEDLDDLAAEIEEKVAELADSFSPDNYEIETFAIKPRRVDIYDVQLLLIWEMAA